MSKVVLVTGANKGIGREICRQLAEQGLTVILTARDESKGIEAAAGMNGDVIVRKLDVTRMDDAKEVAHFIGERFGRLDVLINNAGIINTQPAIETDINEAKRVIDTNFFGPWQVTLAMLPLLKESKEGRIINMSSEMGTNSEMVGGYAAYRLSKHSLNALTMLMSKELAGTGIKVNAMHPGWVRTDMGGPNGTRTVEQGADTAVWLATVNRVPSGKFFFDRQEETW